MLDNIKINTLDDARVIPEALRRLSDPTIPITSTPYGKKDLELVKKLFSRCVSAGLKFEDEFFEKRYSRDPRRILKECYARALCECESSLEFYDRTLKKLTTDAEWGELRKQNTCNSIIRTLQMLEKCTNASDEVFQYMVQSVNENLSWYNASWHLNLSPIVFLVYLVAPGPMAKF